MKYVWKDLPKPLNCFTVRGTTMVNLNTGKIISNYAANTKIVVVQKCVTPGCTYYRTGEAAHHYLNYAFRASAFGLPNELAPSEPSSESVSSKERKLKSKSTNRTHHQSPQKQKGNRKAVLSKGGETKRRSNWFSKIFRRKNG